MKIINPKIGVIASLLIISIALGYGGSCNKSSSKKDTATGSSTPTAPAQVTSPSPANGATGVITTTQLSWAPATDATSYDIYFGTNNPPPYVTNNNQTNYDPGILSYSTTYYWRIDSKNANGTTTGAVWSFTTIVTLPAQVTTPNPGNGETDVITTTQISWASASGATSYGIYFGITPTLTYRTNVVSPTVTYNPGALINGTTYSWRIDSVNAGGTTTGIAWSFTTVSPPPWAKTFGETGNDYLYSLSQTADGGYIVAGMTGSFGAGNGDAWVMKLNSNGTVVWQKAFGWADSEYLYSISQTADGGYIAAGHTGIAGGNSDAWVIKLNSNGTVAWQKIFGGISSDDIMSISQTADGGYIAAGHTGSFGAGGRDAWIIKLNSNGTIAWQKAFGVTGHELIYSIYQTTDGGYIAAGMTDSFGAGTADAWVIKLNSNGTIAWQKAYGGTSSDGLYSISQTDDGGYIAAGETKSFGAGNNDAWIIKLNSNGTVAWQKVFGGTGYDYVKSISQTDDGGYIAAGTTDSFGAGFWDAWVIKLNSDGSSAWQKTFGGTNYDHVKSIYQTADGGYIAAGYTGSFGLGNGDGWVIKLNSDGSIQFNPTSGASVTNTSVSPVDTNATVTDTSVTVTDTTVTGTDSTATVTDTNMVIQQQAP